MASMLHDSIMIKFMMGGKGSGNLSNLIFFLPMALKTMCEFKFPKIK